MDGSIETKVPRGVHIALGALSGDVVVEPNAVIRAERGHAVEVPGRIEFRGNATVEEALHATEIEAGRRRLTIHRDV